MLGIHSKWQAFETVFALVFFGVGIWGGNRISSHPGEGYFVTVISLICGLTLGFSAAPFGPTSDVMPGEESPEI